jgi:hypothetical protein
VKKVRIGTFNVNNLFERPRVMELEGFSDKGKEVLKDVARLGELLEKDSYAGEVGNEIVKLLNKYFHEEPDNPWFYINEIKEKLYGLRQDGSGVFLKVGGRKEWLGWVELVKQQTNEISVQNTALLKRLTLTFCASSKLTTGLPSSVSTNICSARRRSSIRT